MSRGTPSMLALLGLLAVAGYQNRDKIKEMLGNSKSTAGDPERSGLAGVLGNLGGLLGGAAGSGNVLSGGLGDIIERFKQSGQQKAADSWVKTGPNLPITPDDLEKTLGEDDLRVLTEKTGLTRQELLSRLARELPDAVDKYTPGGTLP